MRNIFNKITSNFKSHKISFTIISITAAILIFYITILFACRYKGRVTINNDIDNINKYLKTQDNKFNKIDLDKRCEKSLNNRLNRENYQIVFTEYYYGTYCYEIRFDDGYIVHVGINKDKMDMGCNRW